MKVFLLFMLSLLPLMASAFPENVRHGYSNCGTCHFSPSGGGSLTSYGRQLSEDILSTWSAENESKFLYLGNPSENFHLGGDVRVVQVYQDDPFVRQAFFIPMQFDVEAAAQFGQFTIESTLGAILKRSSSEPTTLGSRRHWLSYSVDESLMFRAGKFYPAFGVMIPEHISLNKKYLGFDQGMETYNLEASFTNEKFQTFLTGIVGRPDDIKLRRRSGVSVAQYYSWANNQKVGISYLYGKESSNNHHIIGLSGILSFKEMVLIIEHDLAWNRFKDASDKYAFHTYQKLGYEITQGLTPYFSVETSNKDLSTPELSEKIVGPGVQWMPRPHWEFNTQFQFKLNPAFDKDWYKYAYLMAHYYF